MSLLELAAGPARVIVDAEAGGRIAAVTVAGLELLVGRDEGGGDPMQWGSFPMAPWSGRLRRGRFAYGGQTYQLDRDLPPHAIHGTVYRRPWTVEEVTKRACSLVCDLGPGWPFAGLVRQHLELDAGALHLTLAVHALEVPMPAACGWHPWWRRAVGSGGPLELELDFEGRWQRGADGLPTGKLVAVGERPPRGWDDCFTPGAKPPVLRWPGAVELTIDSDAGALVVYDEPEHAVCIEPATGPPNALNLAPLVVDPGRPLVTRSTWSWVLG